MWPFGAMFVADQTAGGERADRTAGVGPRRTGRAGGGHRRMITAENARSSTPAPTCWRSSSVTCSPLSIHALAWRSTALHLRRLTETGTCSAGPESGLQVGYSRYGNST